MSKELLFVVTTIVFAVSLLKGVKEIWHYRHHTIPQQLADLIRQAHLEVPFRTLWNIEVGPAMQDALRMPLTLQQIAALSQAGDDIIKRSINCHVASHKLKAGELSGIVSVSLKISSHSGTHNYAISKARLRIVVSHIGAPGISNKWIVSSVEQV